MSCLADERLMGVVGLLVAVAVGVAGIIFGTRWSLEWLGTPFFSGWTTLTIAAATFGLFFLATGYGIIPPSALSGCD